MYPYELKSEAFPRYSQDGELLEMEQFEYQESEVATPPAAATTTACAKGLICLEHVHVPKQPDPKKPGTFIVGSLTRLEPKNMNPGFIDTADNLITNRSGTGLQTCLSNLLTTQFKNYLTPGSISKKSAARDDRVRVGLVDLSGSKLAQPDFAGWGLTVASCGITRRQSRCVSHEDNMWKH